MGTDPGRGLGRASPVQLGREAPEILARMELVDPLPGLGELVSGEIPDPGGAVSEDQGRLGLEEPALAQVPQLLA